MQIIDAFAGFRQTMDECFKDFRADLGTVQERLRERGRLIKELRSKVSSAATTPGPRYAPEDPTLPRPWRGLIDGSTGSLYYWNTATNQTQYERPCEQAWITHPEYPPTLPSSEYPVHSNTPPYTPDFPPLTHPTNPHPTQSVYLHRKQLRGFRRRVSMAATRQLFKATRKQNLLSTAGKDSRTQVNRKNGLWAVKAQNGCVFPEIMQELCQLCLEARTDTSSSLVTSHSPSPVISSGLAVPERKEVLHSMAASVLADEKPLQPLSVTAVEDGYCEGLFKVIISASDGSCSHSDLSYQTHSHASDATNVEIGISNVVELLVPEAVDKHGFNSSQEDLCSDSSIVQQVTVTNEFYLQESDGSCKPSLLLGDYEMILDEDQMLAVHDQSAVVTSPLFLQLLLGVENVPWQQIVTGAKSNERISTAKFGSGVFEFNFKVTIIPCCNIEFVLELLPGIQLHTDRSIKDQKPGDLEKAQLDLIHCYHNILIASVTPQLTVYGLKTLPLEFESHLNYVINDFDVLGDDYFMLAFLCADCSLCLCANYSIPCSVRISLLSKDMIFYGDLLSAAPCESDIMLNEYYHLNQAKEFNEWAQGLVVEWVAQFITSSSKVLLPIAYVTSNLLAIESSVISVIPRCGETKRTDDVFGAINQLHQLSMSPAEWFEKMLVDADNLLFDNMSASDIKLDSFLPSTGWDSDIDSIDMTHLGNSDIVYEDLLVTSLQLMQVLHPKVFRMANVLEKTGHRMVLEKSAAVMFVNHGNYLTLGIEDGDLGVVEVQKMELDLAELCNQISSQSVVNLLEEVAAIDMGKLRDERFLFPDGFNELYQANSKLYSLSTLQQSGHEAWRVHNIYYMLTLQEGPPSGVHVEIMNYELVQNACQMDQGDCKTLFARASLPLSLTEATELYKGMDISAITQLYSKFLLLWLVHAQHEHSKWSATIYLALIAGCLHVRDHKPKFENMTRLVPEMCSSTINLVKGASGFGLGFSAVMSEEKFIIEFFEILEDMNIEALMSTAYLRRVQFWGFASNKAAYINFLVGPCVNSGDIRSGQKMFDNFSCPNVFSVTDVLPGYHLEVIKLFREMQFWGAKRNQVTLAVELNSSASMGNLKETVTKNYFGNFVNIQPNTDFRSAKRDLMPIDEGRPYCLHGYVDERNQCSLCISSDNALHKFATTKYYRATVESREKQLKGSIMDTYLGGVLGDAARPQAKLRHDVVQAPPAWLLTATAFLLSTSLIPCALLLAVMQVISIIAAALAEFTSEVYMHINAKISTHVAALTFGSTSFAQVIEDSSALRTSLFLRGWNC